MEVSLDETHGRLKIATPSRVARSIFDCDGTEIDAILGRTKLGSQSLRFDSSHVAVQSAKQGLNEIASTPKSGHQSSPEPIGQDDSSWIVIERAERLARLLSRDQAWYEARQKAAQEAERSLALLEHQQESWLGLV